MGYSLANFRFRLRPARSRKAARRPRPRSSAVLGPLAGLGGPFSRRPEPTKVGVPLLRCLNSPHMANYRADRPPTRDRPQTRADRPQTRATARRSPADGAAKLFHMCNGLCPPRSYPLMEIRGLTNERGHARAAGVAIEGSCPWTWCKSWAAGSSVGRAALVHAAAAGSMRVRSSRIGAMVSRVM